MYKMLHKNRRAFHDYEVLERFEAGLVLKGHEAKSLRNKGGNFTGAFVSLNNEELFLKQFNIRLYEKANLEHYEPTRPRKLLLNRKEIDKMASALNTKGVTLIPLSYGLKFGRIKFEIGIARGKKSYDKRATLKAKDEKRRIEKQLRSF